MKNKSFLEILNGSILCNNASSIEGNIIGDSIEVALLDFAHKAEYEVHRIRKNNPKELELPFDAERKLMATVHRNQQHFKIYVKGAFEALRESCNSILIDGKKRDFTNKEIWKRKVDQLASKGLRTLAFAYHEVEKIPQKENLAQNLVFLGIIGFLDPAREDVKATIEIYKKAGFF